MARAGGSLGWPHWKGELRAVCRERSQLSEEHSSKGTGQSQGPAGTQEVCPRHRWQVGALACPCPQVPCLLRSGLGLQQAAPQGELGVKCGHPQTGTQEGVCSHCLDRTARAPTAALRTTEPPEKRLAGPPECPVAMATPHAAPGRASWMGWAISWKEQ